MEQRTRNVLRNVVTQCRKLLEEAIASELQGRFGLFTSGKRGGVTVEPDDRMTHLSDEDRAYRRDLIDHFEHIRAGGPKPKEALDQLIREVAFTHLNRLCAYRMMEARELIRESVKRGLKSQGFLFYLADHPEDERRHNAGEQDVAYRHFLDWLGGTLSEEIGILFAPTDPANRLYPPQRVLDQVIGLLNGDEIKAEETELRTAFSEIWSQDETIGWVYQYFTPQDLRDGARKESRSGPRNSYELAFLNQFFTPRYVVEFLIDNTLGRTWYEMRKGKTSLVGRCRYLIRRPTELFLVEGEAPPAQGEEAPEELSQEELLRRPVYIPHRLRKDPRELKVLDPACGSGHFLLYAFDLLLTIYEEAYEDSETGPTLQRDYPTLGDLQRDVPRLILANNLHGIDIDLRATQIAALALWLRSQRAWQEWGIAKADRPVVTRSNIVCAEQMPGEEALLDEFLQTLNGDRLERLIRRVAEIPKPTPVRTTEAMAESLSGLVRLVWDRMKLAGEAGSLLKIEEEIQEAVRTGRKEWEEHPLFRLTDYSLSEIPVEKYVSEVPGESVSFWDRAEGLLIAALDEYASFAANGGKLLRTLFVDDAIRGFAFVDLCRQRYDSVVMNPPFGMPSKPSAGYLSTMYPCSKSDLAAAFIDRGATLLAPGRHLGAITTRTPFFLSTFSDWRETVLLPSLQFKVFADLGKGVLDAAEVETAAYCLSNEDGATESVFARLLKSNQKSTHLAQALNYCSAGDVCDAIFLKRQKSFRDIPNSPLAYWPSKEVLSLYRDLPAYESADGKRTTRCGLGTTDVFRFLRLHWEVSHVENRSDWVTYYNGGTFSPIYEHFPLVVRWGGDGSELKDFIAAKFGSASRKVQAEDHYFKRGYAFPKRTKGLAPKVMPAQGIFSDGGQAGFAPDDELLWAIGVLASNAVSYLLSLSQGRTGDAAQFQVDLIKNLPWPDHCPLETRRLITEQVEKAYAAKMRLDAARETSHFFTHAFAASGEHESIGSAAEKWNHIANNAHVEYQQAMEEIDALGLRAYGIDQIDLVVPGEGVDIELDSSKSVPGIDFSETLVASAASFLSYATGCVFGRWDLRFATGDRVEPPIPDPFLPYPSMPLGSAARSPSEISDSPLRSCPIFTDDPQGAGDIVQSLREAIRVIWLERAEAIEHELSSLLGSKSLREYFRKPGKGGFWADHISRYSTGGRKAPVYWLLQSSKKNYGLWLYYHQLDKDLLFKALLNHVEPKLRLEQAKMDSLRQEKAAGEADGREAKRLAKVLEKQEDFLSELRDFEDKLRRAAELRLNPDLNDGVVLNIAPLHELVPWKEAKKYWDKLTAGEYEWSSIGKQLREKGLVG